MKDFNKAIEGLWLMTFEELTQSIESAAIAAYEKPNSELLEQKKEARTFGLVS